MLDKKKKIILITGFIIATIIIIAGIFIVCEFNTYNSATQKEAEYRNLATKVKESSVNKSKEILKAENNEKDSVATQIDFKSVTEIFPDAVGWMSIPDTNMEYSIMQGTENEPLKYLWKDPYGEKSKTGSIFTRFNDLYDKDATTIIYGHHLQDTDIFFSSLLNFKEDDYALSHQILDIYTKTGYTRYSLVYVCEGLDTDPVYFYPYDIGSQEYEYLLTDLNNRAVIKIDNIAADEPIVVLSTCSGKKANQPERLYLVYKIKK